jgi:hypothetical protein
MAISISNLPEFLSSQDLVSLGLFSSVDAAYVARARGHSPEFLKIGKRVLYPKASLLQFIETRLTNSSSRSTNTAQST